MPVPGGYVNDCYGYGHNRVCMPSSPGQIISNCERRGIVEKAQETRFGMSPKYSSKLPRASFLGLDTCTCTYV